MITEKQILDATKEVGISISHYEASDIWVVNGHKLEKLQAFAKHFYKQGLLDAASKCDEISDEYDNQEIYSGWVSQALSKMVKEIGNDK